ncbi:MAG: sensor histidine kinase [Thermoanaerobaculia bacterium]
MRLLPPDQEQGWTRYAWLVYLGFIFVQPSLSGKLSDWVLVSVALAVFLPLYFVGYWIGGRRILWVVAAMTLLGVLCTPYNAGGVGFFIYAASFLCRLHRPRLAIALLIAIAGVLSTEAWIVGFDNFTWAVGGVFTVLIGGINLHFAEAARARARLELAHGEVERLAALAERERIARDLHDLLGHTLSLITLKAELAAKLLSRDRVQAEREIREVEAISRQALAEVRGAVRGYRRLSLGAELSKAKVALGSAGVEVDVDTGPYSLDDVVESAVALALREAVTNVVRHARADRCRIRLEQREGRFVLEVADDGRGGSAPDGVGLSGMRERLGDLGGTVDRIDDRGTRLVVEVPVAGEGRHREAAS